VFRYTAAGQKVAKLVYQTGKPVRRTDYLGPYQYEQDSLRFFPHAAGRVLRLVNATSGAVRYQREFTFKDHLGNLRLAYRLGQHRVYTATLEQDAATHGRESQQFDSLSVSAPVAQAVGGAARTGAYVARLNAGGSAPQPLGALTQVAVQKGDTVTVSAPGYYPQATSSNSFAFSLASFVAGLLQPPPGAPRLDGRRGGLPLLSLGVSAGLPALVQASGGVPQGYVRLLVFDADSNLVGSQTRQLSQAARAGYEPLQVQVIAPQDGYVTAYVGNESNADVYFDDVTVTHGQGLQVQENQYDPFGLDLAGVSGAAPGLRLKNFYQFNGKEQQNDLGLNWSDYGARFYSSDVAHWTIIDPLAENMRRWSPYVFSFDNPIRFLDADGMWPHPVHIRSFAPFPSFGGGFEGDGANRGYTTATGKGEGGSVTSRQQHAFTVDPTQGTYKAGNAWSDESKHPILGSATGTTHANITGFKATSDSKGNSTTSFTANMAAANPLTARIGVPTPDIDVHTSFTLTENQKAGTLNVSAVQTGDAFPAAETFIGDTKGNQLFIGVKYLF